MKQRIAIGICAVTLLALGTEAQDMSTWYPFQPDNEPGPSEIGMEDWNPEPAGAHGRVERIGDKLVYDGKEIKLWGLNNTYGACAPEKEMADKRAALYRKFGMNAMRLHKYADGADWSGIQSADSFVNLDPAGLDRMDYYIHTLKQNGIFTKLSPTFGVKIGPAEFGRIPYLEEVGKPSKGRIRAAHGWVNLATEIQDLQIAQTLGVLNHKNPYSGMRYADDPAIFCVEIYNEDCVLFSGTNGKLQQSPTMRSRHGKGFSLWLKQKYGNETAWREAWGAEAVVSGPANVGNEHLKNMIKTENVKGNFPAESLDAGTVVPWGHYWFYDAAMDPESDQAFLHQRLLDTMQYLIGLQNEFYARFVKAIHATGFKGEIIGSNWQAGSLVGHLLNLHSDHLVGMIDRHNYFGGGRGAWNGKSTFKDGTMLARPGMGSLSAGFQQVANRPFMLSEWIHVQPNEYYVEGPAILGAYGWGLQGWDVSYIFQNRDEGGFSSQLGLHAWDVTNPMVLGVYPAVSRQVRRLDVSEAPDTVTLSVHVPSLAQGRMGFSGKTAQSWDEKTFSTDKTPMEALAVTRVAVDFAEEYRETSEFDLRSHLDGRTVVSATKQLRWTPAPEGQKKGGHFTIDTPATKAFVGFSPGGETFDLGDGVSITPAKGFAAIYLSAQGKTDTIASAKQLIVTAIARGRNTGMKLNDEENRIVAKGKGPIVMEPIKAEITLAKSGNATVTVLDHDGRRTARTLPVSGGRIGIDGARDKTPYYLISYE